MSRFSSRPIAIPSSVQCEIKPDFISVRGSLGEIKLFQHRNVKVTLEENGLMVKPPAKNEMNPLVGTYWRLLSNHIHGVSQGFERKLELVGVGYRASRKGERLVLTLGFSHPVEITPPEGIRIEVPAQTAIVVKGVDKQKVNQFAAEIRAWRPPEPYKGKGIKYEDEVILRKEVKKK